MDKTKGRWNQGRDGWGAGERWGERQKTVLEQYNFFKWKKIKKIIKFPKKRNREVLGRDHQGSSLC